LIESQDQPPADDFIGMGQVEEAVRAVGGRRIDALLINIGGNDAGFSGVLENLLREDNVFTANKQSDPDAVKDNLDRLIGVGLPLGEHGQIENDLEALRGLVVRNLNPRAVYLSGYPVALFDVTEVDATDPSRRVIGFQACGLFQARGLKIDQLDYELIVHYGTELNALLKHKAHDFTIIEDAAPWLFIDVAADFVGRGYCDRNSLWVGAESSCLQQGDFDGTMHPNRDGHGLWALRFVEALRQHTVRPLRLPPDGSTRPDDPGEVRPA